MERLEVMLSEKNIMLGVSGSIAAYKAVELLRRLMDHGAYVRVVMTKNACRFISPLTFETLCRCPVLIDEFEDSNRSRIGHIDASASLDAAIIAPATANIIGKIAHGIGDDALTSTVLALDCPLLIAPAMNERMFKNPAVQRNIEILEERGVVIIEPETGHLACGTEGYGRLASVEKIIEEISSRLYPADLTGVTVLVTAGPTREHMDPVRFISNPSTGRMGYAVARAARMRGAEVILVSGPTHLTAPSGVRFCSVITADDMRRAVLEYTQQAHVIVMAAAVSDFRPARVSERKIKKESASTTIELERTADILSELGGKKAGRILVGFAAETDSIIENARRKLEQKGLDMIIANDVLRMDAGFGAETNAVTIIDRFGAMEELPVMPKHRIAWLILDRVVQLMNKQGISP